MYKVKLLFLHIIFLQAQPVTPRYLESLIRLSTALAKLNNYEEVVKWHVDKAVSIMEMEIVSPGESFDDDDENNSAISSKEEKDKRYTYL